MSSPGAGGFDRLAALLDGASQAPSLAHLIEAGADELPLPGDGRTLARWQALAVVAARDLTLVKLFEGHTDALAILAELGGPIPPPASRWGTWCAEPPDARVELRESADGSGARLHGTKSWCSGAASSTHAVISCWNARGEPCLAAVALDQPGVTVTDTGWHAVGMAGTGSVDVRFDDAVATPVGQPGDYVARPGFWQGGAGIAACWYGGAQGIAEMTRRRLGPKPDAHRLAHLGAIDVALAGAAAVLREAAAWIDAHPRADAQRVAARARLAVEHAATRVLDHAGRALGAGPLCRDARFARAMADLPVFLRQSHAERDLASLGTGLLPKRNPRGNCESVRRRRPFAFTRPATAGPVGDRAIEGAGTSEADWLRWLDRRRLPEAAPEALVPPGCRAVVVAPHPDDEVLSVGGLFGRLHRLGRELLVVAATDGTGSHDGSPLWPPERLARERPLETAEALRRLDLASCEVRRLGLPDGGLMRSRGALAERVAALLRPGDVVFTTWRFDGHPDHEATGQACAAVAACMGVTLVEVPVWAWHWAAAGDARLPWSRARRVALDADTAHRKADAVDAFRSQLLPDESTGAGPILRSTTVERARRPFEVVFT